MTQTKPTFAMMLECPAAYRAHMKGFGRALAAGHSPDEAARRCGLSPSEVAGALTFKKLGHAARGAGRNLGHGASFLARTNPAFLSLKYTGKGLGAATKGIR